MSNYFLDNHVLLIGIGCFLIILFNILNEKFTSRTRTLIDSESISYRFVHLHHLRKYTCKGYGICLEKKPLDYF